jgi:hypothetical protein
MFDHSPSTLYKNKIVKKSHGKATVLSYPRLMPLFITVEAVVLKSFSVPAATQADQLAVACVGGEMAPLCL